MRAVKSIQLGRPFLIWLGFAAILLALMLIASAVKADDGAPQSSNTPPILSTLRLEKIDKLISNRGRILPKIPPLVMERLRLPENQLRGIAIKESSGFIHVFARLSDGGIFISFINATTASSYHVDQNLTLIASVAMTSNVPSDIPDPERSLNTELIYWANLADQLDDAGKPK